MTALEYFRLFAVEFALVADATVEVWLSVAGKLASVAGLDEETTEMALALYAAHLYTLNQRQAGGQNVAQGVVLREKEGDLERTYSGVKGNTTWLGLTTYGQQYNDITRTSFGSAIMTRVAP